MKTAVRETSREAHHAIRVSGVAITKANIIAAYIRAHPKSSRQDVSQGTRISINCTCGRVAELIESGVVRECGSKQDSVSGKRVMQLEVVPAQTELELA